MLIWKISAPRKGDEQTGECNYGARSLLQCVDCDWVTTTVTPWLLTPPLGDARMHTTAPKAPSANASHCVRVTFLGLKLSLNHPQLLCDSHLSGLSCLATGQAELS